jgi:hypothetical protein
LKPIRRGREQRDVIIDEVQPVAWRSIQNTVQERAALVSEYCPPLSCAASAGL